MRAGTLLPTKMHVLFPHHFLLRGAPAQCWRLLRSKSCFWLVYLTWTTSSLAPLAGPRRSTYAAAIDDADYLSERCEAVPKNHASDRTRQNHAGLSDHVGGAWWSLTESNRRHPACKAGALPTELRPLKGRLVGRGGLEPPTSRLSGVRSNHLSYRPIPKAGRCKAAGL